MNNKIKVTHIITGLNTGGAEMMLYKLLSRMDNESFSSDVISLTDIGLIGKKIEALGGPIRSLGMRRGLPDPMSVIKLTRWLRQMKPDVIQTWMYHADLIGGLVAKIAGRIPVAWGVHNSNLDPQYNKLLTIWTVRLCAWLSNYLPNRIVVVSDGARKVHEAIGYAPDKMLTIPNGIDTDIFKPNLSCRLSVREELVLQNDSLLIGLVARFDPLKDHRTFIEAAHEFSLSHPDAHFVLCGSGINYDNELLVSWIDQAGLRHRFHLLGIRDDIPCLTAAFNIACSSSFGESFALTLGEAMACEIPCVTTDIEGPVELLGGNGLVVPIGDASALCQAWKETLNTPDNIIKTRVKKANSRIRKKFSLEAMVDNYQRLYTEITH